MDSGTILVLGAGRSSSSLISYLLEHADKAKWKVVVGDYDIHAAFARVGESRSGKAIKFDIEDQSLAEETISAADVVISLLPAVFHVRVANYCLALGKHLLTASYVADEMRMLHEAALNKNLLFLNECGLDPGIDHMSAMEVIDKIHEEGGEVLSFESFTGGLIAPETDKENPWRYKFTWNPRNVVMAGQGTAKFIEEGQYKFIPYQQLFKRTTKVHIPSYGDFEGYANRDSLKYIQTYRLNSIRTMIRGTLRNDGFCSAWNVLVQLGCTDDSYFLESVGSMNHRDFLNSFLPYDDTENVEGKLVRLMGLKSDGPEMKRLEWSGFFSKEPVGLEKGTPAQVLEHILNKKWKLNHEDRDLVVMWHRFRYKLRNEKREVQCYLIAEGEDSNATAMAKGVGLPLAIAAKLLMEGKIRARGVCLPVQKEIYQPILRELKELGIKLDETENIIKD